MTSSLMALGVVCILAAIVGGGMKALGTEIPILRSRTRQWLLAVAGVALLIPSIAGYIQNSRPNDEQELRIGLSLYDKGQFVDALKHIATAARAGNSEAQYHYGLMLMGGEGTIPDGHSGIAWLKKSAEHGYALAQGVLASELISGKNVERDEKSAKEWGDRSARQGNAVGLWISAELEPDTSKKMALLKESAEKGFVFAQVELAERLLVMWSHKDYSEWNPADELGDAIKWLGRAGKQGCSRAQLRLGGLAEVDYDKHKLSEDQIASSYYGILLAVKSRKTKFSVLSPDDEKEAERLLKKIRLPSVDSYLHVEKLVDDWQPEFEMDYRHFK